MYFILTYPKSDCEKIKKHLHKVPKLEFVKLEESVEISGSWDLVLDHPQGSGAAFILGIVLAGTNEFKSSR